MAPRAQFCEQREGGKGIREREEMKKILLCGVMFHVLIYKVWWKWVQCYVWFFWWHGWNAVISYLGHNSAKLKNRRAQKHMRKKNQGCEKKKEIKKEEKCIFCCFKTITKIWLNCALLWKGAKYSWGILFKRLRSFWTRVHATASLRVAHHYL